MRRITAGLLLLLLALAGCAEALGTADWDRVEVRYTADNGTGPKGDYTLVVTPTEASYTIDGKETRQKLPDGAWSALTTGVRAFGDRKGAECADQGEIAIQASAGGAVKQNFEANGCDAGDVFEQAQALVAQIIAQVK